MSSIAQRKRFTARGNDRLASLIARRRVTLSLIQHYEAIYNSQCLSARLHPEHRVQSYRAARGTIKLIRLQARRFHWLHTLIEEMR